MFDEQRRPPPDDNGRDYETEWNEHRWRCLRAAMRDCKISATAEEIIAKAEAIRRGNIVHIMEKHHPYA